MSPDFPLLLTLSWLILFSTELKWCNGRATGFKARDNFARIWLWENLVLPPRASVVFVVVCLVVLLFLIWRQYYVPPKIVFRIKLDRVCACVGAQSQAFNWIRILSDLTVYSQTFPGWLLCILPSWEILCYFP